MELAEVINPHFAFPVVGVVLCAVLVFAFGFKSSVQPPSFTFEDDTKKPKKNKKIKKLQNGHIGSSELSNGSSATSSPKQASTKQSPVGKQTPEKSESKTKKKTPKAVSTPKAKDTKAEKSSEEDAGEWTTALSKKERKMRGKKDGRLEDPSSEASVPVNTKSAKTMDEVTTEIGPGGDAPEIKPLEQRNIETQKPMEQRSTKKDRKKKGESKVNDSAVEKPVVTPASAVDTTQTVSDNKSEETVTPVPETPAERVIKEKNDSAKTEGSPEKKSPKKKKKSQRLPESTEAAIADTTDQTVPIQPDDVVAETTVPDTAAAIAEAMLDTQDLASQDAKLSTSHQSERDSGDNNADKKTARSPKKKKKKTTSSSDTHTEASHVQQPAEGSVTIVESTVVSSTTPSSQSQPLNTGAATDRLEVSAPEEKPLSTQAEASSSTHNKPATSSEEKPKVTFDELGDWQETKAVKKKKKPRREN